MTTPYEDRYRLQAASGNADQTELEAIKRGDVVIDAGVRDDTISGAIDELEVAEDGDDGPPGNEAWAENDLRLDAEVGAIREELQRRVSLLGTAYPFELSGERLIYRPSESGFYEFCLAICLAKSITRKPYTDLPRRFERATAKLVEHYMGSDSTSLHVGWPRDKAIGRRFRTAMKHLEHMPWEWTWSPEMGKPQDPDPKYTKDEGIDFVVIKRLLDDRAGRLYILAQCACGDDWKTKWTELNVDRIKKWFRNVTLVPPVRAFVTPYLLVDEMLRETTGQAGLVFDRARLTRIAEDYLEAAQRIQMAQAVRPASDLVLA
ncbi:hypothetical protein [Lysobacter sp. ESA13C]|uniref:hypothetical protein n=1 Tax=Lysobacter sp. ESA13C TaxID=2862676 RepID=UPI001CBC8C83|nr:hypothetical protein [Lysobacter sp. ESA13C]